MGIKLIRGNKTGFFDYMQEDWKSHAWLRELFKTSIPLPGKFYFDAIQSINELSTILIRMLEKTLLLALDTIFYLIKCALSVITALILAPIALIATILGNDDISALFFTCAALSMTSFGMAVLAAISCVGAIIFNPLYAASKIVGTVFDGLGNVAEPCFN